MRTYDIEGLGMGVAFQQTNEEQYLIAGNGSSVEPYENWDILLMKIDISGLSRGIYSIKVMQANAVYGGKVVVR